MPNKPKNPLKNKKEEHRVERKEANEQVQMREMNKRPLKNSQKLMKGNHRRSGQSH